MPITEASSARFSADRREIAAVLLCMAHCVVGPVLLSYAGFASMIGASEKLELVFLLISATMGTIALVPAYRRSHGRRICLVLFGSGMLFLLSRQFTPRPIEIAVTVCWAGLILAAHALNMRFLQTCRCCDEQSRPAPCNRSSGG